MIVSVKPGGRVAALTGRDKRQRVRVAVRSPAANFASVGDQLTRGVDIPTDKRNFMLFSRSEKFQSGGRRSIRTFCRGRN
jgi:hypothetical protein